MTQEFHLSVTPIRDHDYLVRTEQVSPGVPLAEEHVVWPVQDWLAEAGLLMDDPLLGLLRSGSANGSLRAGSARLHQASQDRSTANLVAFGQRLYNALFQGTIRDSWMMAQGIAQHQRERLRFRLGLKGTNLHRLPWEVLYAGDRPLATGTDVVFSRYHSSFSVLQSHLPFQKVFPGATNQPLKILMVLAAPTDQEVLALKQEAEHLQQELQSHTQSGGDRFSGIELTILEQPGREQLTQALEHNHYQVLHYAGHSNLGAAGGSLYLVSRKTGLTEILTGDDLAGLLVNNGIRMAVFNSCRGVYTATSDSGNKGDGNLAEALVRRGIPAVLAMAERIPDDVALNLSRLFYRNLKQSYPIDLSLSRARQGLISSYGSDQLYWALPILYLHPEFDGNLLGAPVGTNDLSLENQGTGLYGDFYEPVLSFSEVRTDNEPVLAASNGRSPVLGAAETPNTVIDPVVPPASASLYLEEDDLPDFDELEFDDPDPPEEEKVAQLVYELSHNPTILETEEPILPASPTENLLPIPEPDRPSDSYLQLPDNPHYGTQPAASLHNGAAPATTKIPKTVQISDPKVYSELENILAEMGTLTEEISKSNRVLQANPNDAEAYTNLGWALYQQGYLTEAISAYNQAIRLDPNLAITYNRLGLAFYQQGKPDEAVRAYSRAVQLDPTMTEASTNLRAVLYEQTNRPTPSQSLSQPTANTPTGPTGPKKFPAPTTRRPSKRLLWGGITAIALVTATAAWVLRDQWLPWLPILPGSNSSSLESSDLPAQWRTMPADALADLATQELNQGNLVTGQRAIAVLLAQGSLQQAATVLNAVPPQYADTPGINFLKGRVAWAHWLAGDPAYSVENVRQLWDKAANGDPNADYTNALGFAYYAQGKIDRAEQSWTKVLKQSTQSDSNQTPGATLQPETLTAYAGLALTAMKMAEKAPLNEQALFRSEALKRRQVVLDSDQVNFQPEVLSKNWMWSEKAIQDWRSLLAMKS